MPEIDREVAHLSAAREVAGVRAERYFGAAERVGEGLAVLEHVFLRRAVGEDDRDLHRRRAAGGVAARRPGPPADPAEEVQARRGDGRRNLDAPRELVGDDPAAGAALERHQVGAAQRSRRVHDEERNPRHRHVAEAVQRDSLVALVFAAQAAAAVGGVGLAQVDDAEPLVVGSRVGDRWRQ